MLRFQKSASRVWSTFPVSSKKPVVSESNSLSATSEPRFALVQSFDFIYKSIVEPEPPKGGHFPATPPGEEEK